MRNRPYPVLKCSRRGRLRSADAAAGHDDGGASAPALDRREPTADALRALYQPIRTRSRIRAIAQPGTWKMQYGAHGSPPFAPAPQLNQRGGCDRHQTFGHTLGHTQYDAHTAQPSPHEKRRSCKQTEAATWPACPPLSTTFPLSSPPTYRGSRLVRTTYKHRFYFSSQCWCVLVSCELCPRVPCTVPAPPRAQCTSVLCEAVLL